MKIIKRYDFLVNFISPLNIAVRCGDLTIALLTLKWMLHLQFSSLSLLTHIFRKLRHQAIEIYPKNYFIHYFWYWKRPKTLPDLKVATLYFILPHCVLAHMLCFQFTKFPWKWNFIFIIFISIVYQFHGRKKTDAKTASSKVVHLFSAKIPSNWNRFDGIFHFHEKMSNPSYEIRN